jgi:hypothetical protein
MSSTSTTQLTAQLSPELRELLDELRAQGLPEAALSAAVAKAQAAQAKKAKPAQTPAQLLKAQTDQAARAVFALLGLKPETGKNATREGQRQHGRGTIDDQAIMDYMIKHKHKGVAIHKPATKGSKTNLLWTLVRLNRADRTWNGDAKATLSSIHHEFAPPPASFGILSTLKSAYFIDDFNVAPKKAKACSLYDLSEPTESGGNFHSYTLKGSKQSSVAGSSKSSVAGSVARGAGADESDGNESDGNESDAPAAPAPAPAPAPVAVAAKPKPAAKPKAAAKPRAPITISEEELHFDDFPADE